MAFKNKSKNSRKRRSSGKKRNSKSKPNPAAIKKAKLDSWNPKTEIGRLVKSKELKDIDEVLNFGKKIVEPEIMDSLLDLDSELLLVGQSKGKFGGGQRRVFRQTQKKTREGNKPKFSTMAIVGDKDGHVGIGFGKAKETVPAREKAKRKATLNVFKIRRGCGSWACNCGEPHTVPFTVEGKCGSVIVKLMPAPKGKGLCVESEIAKILEFAGVKDVWSKTFGQTKNRINLILAAEAALKKLALTKVRELDSKNTFIVSHSIRKKKKENESSENKSKSNSKTSAKTKDKSDKKEADDKKEKKADKKSDKPKKEKKSKAKTKKTKSKDKSDDKKEKKTDKKSDE